MPATSPTTDIDSRVAQILGLDFTDDFTPGEYSTLLKEAMVRQHPDHGGDAEVFKLLSAERVRTKNANEKFKVVKKKISAANFTSPKGLLGPAKGIGKSPIGDAEEDIHEPLDEILRLLREEHQLEKDAAEVARKKAEDEARAKKEKNLERWTALKKTASAVVKPFRSLWDKIWGFISKVFLGRVLFKLIEWMGDKKNQGKLDNIFKFLKDWWPTMLAAYLLFGNSFGRMIVKLTAKVAIWTAQIVSKLIPQLIAALARLKTGKLLKMLGGKRGKALLMTGGLLAATPGLVNRFTDDGEEGDTGDTTQNFYQGGLVILPEKLQPIQKFAQGGQVRGQGGVDKVPAQLTAGEFVMSKGAVQKYGVDTLASMNAAGGGTNTPTLGGLPALGGGGGGTNSLTEQAKVKTFGSALGDFFSGNDGRSRTMTDLERSQRMSGGGPVSTTFRPSYSSKGSNLIQNFQGGGPVIQRIVNKSTEKLKVGEGNAETLLLAAQERSMGVNPPSSKNNVVQNYEIQKQQVKKQNSSGDSTKVPNFNAEKYISEQKIKTLGL